MKPVIFACQETLPTAPGDIAGAILDLANWPKFHGYGPIPGIQSAEFERQTPDVAGTRIRVKNRDGSSHIEEIVEWQPEYRIRLEMKEFSPPLAKLTTRIDETWAFERTAAGTLVTRSFQLHAKSLLARSLLWAISFLLKRAIVRNLREMRAEVGG